MQERPLRTRWRVLATIALGIRCSCALPHPGSLLPEAPFGFMTEAVWCRARPEDGQRIAVMFWGASRGLEHTLPGIATNLFEPLHALGKGSIDIFAHLMDLDTISNSRFDESAPPPALQQAEMLRPCAYELTSPDDMDKQNHIKRHVLEAMNASQGVLHPYNDLATTMNIYRSRVSLYKAGVLVLEHEQKAGFKYTIVVAARPDTAFLTPVDVQLSMLRLGNKIYVPNYSHGSTSHGVNVRRLSRPPDLIPTRIRHCHHYQSHPSTHLPAPCQPTYPPTYLP